MSVQATISIPAHDHHNLSRISWLRAAILGANDGIISTSSLVIGMASAGASSQTILLTGLAGMTAGALSMASGEYVSVSSQADAESAERARESRELAANPQGELEELVQIYRERGLEEPLAREVARALTEKDALTTHMREELGITEVFEARPVQAAASSALSFVAGAAAPVLLAAAAPADYAAPAIAAGSLVFLLVLGTVGAQIGGAAPLRAAARVAFWGAAAMAATAIIGKVAGAAF